VLFILAEEELFI